MAKIKSENVERESETQNTTTTHTSSDTISDVNALDFPGDKDPAPGDLASAAHPPGTVEPMPEKDIFEEYGESISARNIVGSLLKFNKGDWMYGQEGGEFPVGKRMIVNMDQLLLGWIRWEDQRPEEQRMGLLVDGFKPPARDTLGFGYEPGDVDAPSDTSEWEIDPNSKQPRDPWQFTYYLVMKDPENEDEVENTFTFTTASTGGKTAIGDLCKVYGRKRREGYKDYYPIIALKVGSYKHSQYGKTKVPVLPVVSWVPKTAFGELPAPVDATLQIAQNKKDEDIPF